MQMQTSDERSNPGRTQLVEEGSELRESNVMNSSNDLEIERMISNSNNDRLPSYRLEIANSKQQPYQSLGQLLPPSANNSRRTNQSGFLATNQMRRPYRLEVSGTLADVNQRCPHQSDMPIANPSRPNLIEKGSTLLIEKYFQIEQEPPISTTLYSPLSYSLTNNNNDDSMDIDESSIATTPLVVIDGANVAHAYGQACGSTTPDSDGIVLAVNYFIEANMSVTAVLPSYWMRIKPRNSDKSKENAIMATPQIEALQQLQAKGLLCFCPPSDDDDAYIIHIAKNASKLKSCSGGYIVSCDLFRDAVGRDRRQKNGNNSTGLNQWLNDVRISYTFCNFGMERILFVPNPRHELVQDIESNNTRTM